MFEKKVPVKVDYEALLGQDMLNFISRIDDIEDDANKIDRSLQMHSLEWDANLSESRRHISRHKAGLAMLKKEILDFKARFMYLVNDFRSTSSEEDFDKLKNRIDRMDFENFITRKEFENMLKNK